MRTTNKEFKAQIQDHILNGLSEDYSQEPKDRLDEFLKTLKGFDVKVTTEGEFDKVEYSNGSNKGTLTIIKGLK